MGGRWTSTAPRPRTQTRTTPRSRCPSTPTRSALGSASGTRCRKRARSCRVPAVRGRPRPRNERRTRRLFLGNSGDVPLADDGGVRGERSARTRSRARDGLGYDVCVECYEMAPFPSVAHLRAAEDHLTMLDRMWEERVCGEGGGGGEGGDTRVRPPPNAKAVIHLPFPSAPLNTVQTTKALLPVIAFLERCWWPVVPTPPPTSSNSGGTPASGGPGARRWSTFPTVSPASFFPSPPPPPTPPRAPRTSLAYLARADPVAPCAHAPAQGAHLLVRPTGTPSPRRSLSLLMAVPRLSLPAAYLELQVAKRRSFFVYPGELDLLRCVEARIGGGEVFAPARLGRRMSGAAIGSTGSLGARVGRRRRRLRVLRV
ncbi:hypothetical protein C8F04DRAFT_129722 [Mycena alexandri]|uniref:Uncharacterized protein n=1 Tax=Mycena alexandri TaxID=1745969 RepID=A0AAD6TD32_9AGAR|nr:hypothetical protein C8F04DRAFT_129722 [Mycena alexandri]